MMLSSRKYAPLPLWLKKNPASAEKKVEKGVSALRFSDRIFMVGI